MEKIKKKRERERRGSWEEQECGAATDIPGSCPTHKEETEPLQGNTICNRVAARKSGGRRGWKKSLVRKDAGKSLQHGDKH